MTAQKTTKYSRLEDLDDDLNIDNDVKNRVGILPTVFLFLIALLPTIAYFSDFIPLSQPSESQKNITRWEHNYFTEEETQYLNCSEMINGNSESIDLYVNMGRLKLYKKRRFDLPMDCDSIKNRVLIPRAPTKLQNPIAFIRNIYGIYELQEAFLSISYHSDNIFCYAIDSKGSEELKSLMRKLAGCFENVIVLEKEYDFDRAGHFQDRAHFDCLLNQKVLDSDWSHGILLQNFDMIIKTSEQLSELSGILNGTSVMGFDYGMKERYNQNADWTPRGMKLFKNESLVPAEILDKPLAVRKSLNQVIISKKFVNSMFEKLNLDNIINLFNDKDLFGVDEMLINTLYANYLGLEGQMESLCVEKFDDVLSRLTYWMLAIPEGYDEDCKSKWKRHGMCVFGVEYLEDLSKSPYVIANKVLPNFDFGAIICMREMVQENRTGRNPDEHYLAQFPQFREMQLKANGSYDKKRVYC